MPRNSSGVYTLPSGNPVVPGTTIDAAWANDTMEDMANEITNSLSRTGAGGMLAPFRLADGTVTAPGIAWLNETNSGLYRSGAGSTWVSILGVNTAQFSTVGLTIPAGKALTAQGNASVGGTLAVTGATVFASSLAVGGAITATGGVVGNVTGNVTAASGTSSFNDVTISGSLDMVAGSSSTITGLSTPTNSSDAANKAYVDAQVATRLALAGGTMAGALNMNNFTLGNVATPAADGDAANKAYVDSVAQGLDAKASCKAASVGNLTLFGAQIVDGAGCSVGDRVLVKNQTSAAQNGIYVVSNSTWTRATDADTWNELISAFTFVEQGTVNGNSGWTCTAIAGGTLGVTPVNWVQFSGAGQIDAGPGLVKSGNTLSVGTASSSRIVVNADDIDLATTGVTGGTYRSVTVDAYGRVTAGTNPTTLAGYGITDAYTTTQVDALVNAKLSLTGGTMSGAIAMGANKITGMADPTNPQDAATKSYIDTIFGSTTSAAASATAAANSASAAATSATNAATSASNAATSATNASTTYTNFNNQYLGSKTSDPTVNNTGGALVAGNLYWNSTVNEMRVYNGSAWVAAYLPAAGYMDLTTNQTAAGIKTFSSNPVLSAGTANGVAYLNGSKALTTGSALTFDGTTLKATASDAKLDVQSVGASGAFVRLAGNGGTLGSGSFDLIQGADLAGYIYNRANAPLIFGANNAEGMRLTSTGLGIGTSSPSSKLSIAVSTTAANADIELGNSAGVKNYVFTGGSTNATTRWRNNLILYTGGAQDILFETNATERARIDSSGRLGVGMVPAASQGTLQVFGVGVSGGAPATSGTTDANQIAEFGAGSVQLSFGAYANGDAWIQQRSSANFATNYGVGINPNGGRIFVGGAIQEFRSAIGASAIDLSLGNYYSKTISGTTTFTVSNVPATNQVASFILDLTNGGSATINWWTGVKWAGGTAPTLTSSGRDVLGFFTYDNGTTWTGLVLAKDVK